MTDTSHQGTTPHDTGTVPDFDIAPGQVRTKRKRAEDAPAVVELLRLAMGNIQTGRGAFAWIGVGLLLAALKFLADGLAIGWWGVPLPVKYESMMRAVGFGASWLWIAYVIYTPFLLRWRALWLLETVPLALYFSYVDYSMDAACAADFHACP